MDSSGTGSHETAAENVNGTRNVLDREVPKDLDWLKAEFIKSYTQVGSEETTAQCAPYQFTKMMFDEACAAGGQLIVGEVFSVHPEGNSNSSILVEYVEKAHSTSINPPRSQT